MIAFVSLLGCVANKAGMKVPADPDRWWNPNEFPHFAVFKAIQLGVPMEPADPDHNARIIKDIPDEQIRKVTFDDLKRLGVVFR
jgi:hypothetical protein